MARLRHGEVLGALQIAIEHQDKELAKQVVEATENYQTFFMQKARNMAESIVLGTYKEIYESNVVKVDFTRKAKV